MLEKVPLIGPIQRMEYLMLEKVPLIRPKAAVWGELA